MSESIAFVSAEHLSPLSLSLALNIYVYIMCNLRRWPVCQRASFPAAALRADTRPPSWPPDGCAAGSPARRDKFWEHFVHVPKPANMFLALKLGKPRPRPMNRKLSGDDLERLRTTLDDLGRPSKSCNDLGRTCTAWDNLRLPDQGQHGTTWDDAERAAPKLADHPASGGQCYWQELYEANK